MPQESKENATTVYALISSWFCPTQQRYPTKIDAYLVCSVSLWVSPDSLNFTYFFFYYPELLYVLNAIDETGETQGNTQGSCTVYEACILKEPWKSSKYEKFKSSRDSDCEEGSLKIQLKEFDSSGVHIFVCTANCSCCQLKVNLWLFDSYSDFLWIYHETGKLGRLFVCKVERTREN